MVEGKGMTFDELETSIRMKIDDEDKTRFTTSTPIRLSLNEAYRHLYREMTRRNIYTLVKEENLTFTADTQEKAFTTTDIQKVIHVEDVDKFPIPIYSEEMSKRSNERSVYVRRNTATPGGDAASRTTSYSLGYYIKPGAALEVCVRYIPRVAIFPSTITGTTEINDIPEEHHDVIVLYAILLLLGADEDNAKYWTAIYQNAFDSMMESLHAFNETSDGVVDVTNADYSY